ncbi:MAG: hypothetical protein KAR45_19755 [Desulfobacteraceae bacterium]|nr:hypothetical protein [Desulfobacteraceae bacterium]
MSTINDFTQENFIQLHTKIGEQSKKLSTIEQAAQGYMDLLYNSLSESIVLCRFFLTIRFNDLPRENKKFVKNLAESKDVSGMINNDTLILSLLGSRGENSHWNQRQNSQGHVGIPLVSSKFIDKIPMMSRLLKELGVGIDWIDNKDTEIVIRSTGSMGGVFYVGDARITTDSRNRLIISEQDFVEDYDIKSVFGIGGGYLGAPIFFTTIIFLRDYILREQANKFMLQSNKFKTATINLIEQGKIFVNPH